MAMNVSKSMGPQNMQAVQGPPSMHEASKMGDAKATQGGGQAQGSQGMDQQLMQLIQELIKMLTEKMNQQGGAQNASQGSGGSGGTGDHGGHFGHGPVMHGIDRTAPAALGGTMGGMNAGLQMPVGKAGNAGGAEA